MSVFKKLLTPVLEELRQMQQQQVDECALPSAAEPATSGGTCSGGASDAAQQYIISGERGRVLEQQQKRSGRMQILLHKVRPALRCCFTADWDGAVTER
jgi:hypothetical protein